MLKILYYYLNYKPGTNGSARIIFRLQGEARDRVVDVSSTDFIAISAVLAQKKIAYHNPSGTFISYDDDDNLNIANQNLLT